MKRKPISPVLHGVIDYVFSAALLTIPRIIGLNKKAVRLYAVNGISTALYSAVTDYPLGIQPVIPYKTHRIIDCANIASLALATLYKPVQKDKLALAFNTTMAAAAILTVLLTDWNKKPEDETIA